MNSQSVDLKSNLESFLKRSLLSVLSFYHDNKIYTKFTYFAHDNEGHFFLTNPCHESEFEMLKNEQNVTLLVYKEEETLQDIHQILIEGKAQLVDKNSSECKQAYQKLGSKSPLIGQLAYNQDETGQYPIIKLIPSSISMHSVLLMEKNLPPIKMHK